MRAIHLVAALGFLLAGCAPKPAPAHDPTGVDESAVRAAFNGAADRTRLVLLLSPT